MYSVDLSKISLDEFKSILLSFYLLPSQRMILVNLEENIETLKGSGLSNLADLRALLGKKKGYPILSETLRIDEADLVLLNRMVNSFVVKELPLARIEIFLNEELRALALLGMTNTRQYYETFTDPGQKEKALSKGNLPPDKVDYALHIIDLLRINGIGVDYAKTLYRLGITCVRDYNNTPSQVILHAVQELNKREKLSKATLGITDVDYCRRFSQRLDHDLL